MNLTPFAIKKISTHKCLNGNNLQCEVKLVLEVRILYVEYKALFKEKSHYMQ
jgi:hypothetical protein